MSWQPGVTFWEIIILSRELAFFEGNSPVWPPVSLTLHPGRARLNEGKCLYVDAYWPPTESEMDGTLMDTERRALV